MNSWKLEDAKNRFSELLRRAAAEGPQPIGHQQVDLTPLPGAEIVHAQPVAHPNAEQDLLDGTGVGVEHLPTDRRGRARVELVYCQKPPQKESRDWMVVYEEQVPF